jgi:DNA replication and repair protein RecF
VYIRSLRLQNFRNYREAQFNFDKKVIGLFGKNGSGKTNILDAIHYLSFSKSVLNNQDGQNISHGENYFLLECDFEKVGHQHSIRCVFDGKKKKLLEDGQEYSRFSEHIGKYPVIMIMPQDINLIWEAGEGRRRFFDLWFSQADRHYLNKLVEFHHLLKQRNGLLKAAQNGLFDRDLMDSYHHQLAPVSEFIFMARKKFIKEINPLLQNEYSQLIRSGEVVSVVYSSDLDSKPIHTILTENLEKEIVVGRTLEGIQRDEYQFLLNDFEVRKYASQGQQKSFLIGLKMVELAYGREKSGFSPILLLDDIFDKMDDDRIARLMEILSSDTVGQFFITDANPGRARDIFKTANLDFQEFLIEKGEIIKN